MEKLTTHIPQFRIGSETKKILLEISDKEKRKLTELCRITLENFAQSYINKQKPNKK